MQSFIPTGWPEATTTAAVGLDFLRAELGIDFSGAYLNDKDGRHEFAVLAVDVARRRLDLTQELQQRLDLDFVVHQRLAARARVYDDMSGDVPLASTTDGLYSQLHARVAELDRVLKLVVTAYKQSWWSDAQPSS